MSDDNRTTALARARGLFRDELLEAGLLIPTGIDGLYGRSGVFEDIVDGISCAATAAARRDESDEDGTGEEGTPAPGGYHRLRFPPVFPREDFERTDYIASFPDLTGAVTTFSGGDREHAALLADRAAGHDWDGHLSPAGTMLVSAACHPWYGRLAGQLPEGGASADIRGYCFRHEPAVDPARMQAFRMHEFVRVGTATDAERHRRRWIGRALGVLGELGLDAEPVVANDPFFGRAGRILAAGQREENLKTELVVRLYDDLDDGTAIVSANCHRDHFGETFGIRTDDGQVAHSACVGFGLERIALAMVRTHGDDPRTWPSDVRERMCW